MVYSSQKTLTFTKQDMGIIYIIMYDPQMKKNSVELLALDIHVHHYPM